MKRLLPKQYAGRKIYRKLAKAIGIGCGGIFQVSDALGLRTMSIAQKPFYKVCHQLTIFSKNFRNSLLFYLMNIE